MSKSNDPAPNTPPAFQVPPPAAGPAAPVGWQPPAPAPAEQQPPAKRRRRFTFKRLLLGTLALFGLIVLLAVIASPKGAVSAVAPGALPATTSASDSDVYVPPGAQAAAAPLAFGSEHKWEDGLAVKLGKPQSFKPGKYAALTSSPAARYVTMEVTILNGTPANYAAGSTTVDATAGGAAAEKVFDSGSKISWAPTTDVLPGKAVTFRVAFAIAEKAPVDLQVEVGPAYGVQYSKAIYTGTF